MPRALPELDVGVLDFHVQIGATRGLVPRAHVQIVHAGAAALAREAGVHLRIYGYKAPFRITAEHCTSVGEAA